MENSLNNEAFYLLKKAIKARILLLFLGLISILPLIGTFVLLALIPLGNNVDPQDLRFHLAFKSWRFIVLIDLPLAFLAVYFLAGFLKYLRAFLKLKEIPIRNDEGYLLKESFSFWWGPFSGVKGLQHTSPYSFQVRTLNDVLGVPSESLYSFLSPFRFYRFSYAELPRFWGFKSKVLLKAETLDGERLLEAEKRYLERTSKAREAHLEFNRKGELSKEQRRLLKPSSEWHLFSLCGKVKKTLREQGGFVAEIAGNTYDVITPDLFLMLPQQIFLKLYIFVDKKKKKQTILNFEAADVF